MVIQQTKFCFVAAFGVFAVAAVVVDSLEYRSCCSKRLKNEQKQSLGNSKLCALTIYAHSSKKAFPSVGLVMNANKSK